MECLRWSHYRLLSCATLKLFTGFNIVSRGTSVKACFFLYGIVLYSSYMLTHDYKLFFIHIPKCAGRSLCSLFNQRFDHLTALYYIREYEQHWQAYTKFTIVRNPYARLVSIYHYTRQHRRHQYEPITTAGGNFKTWLVNNVNTFNRTCLLPMTGEGQRGTDGDIGSPFWFTPQAERLEDYTRTIIPEIDVLRFEDGATAIEQYLLEKTKISFTLPHENKSSHDHYSTYYDNELLQFLNRNYPPIAMDCASFGYNYALKVQDLS